MLPDVNDELPWLSEAMQLYKEKPERIEQILMWVYAKGVMNCQRAMENEDA